MGNKIGSKIELSGEKEFRQAISNINQQMKTLTSEMKLATSAFDKNDKSAEALTATNQVLYKQIEKQKEKIAVLGDALKGAQLQYGENDTKTQKWQQSINNAQAELNRLTRELQHNEEEIERSEKATEELETENEKFGKTLEDTSEKTDIFGDVLKANLASEAITGGIKAIGEKVEEVSEKVIDVGKNFKASMSQVSATMGITTEEINSGSEAYKELEDSAKACGAATKYTASEAGDALNYMALAGYNVEEATNTLPDVLNLASAGAYDLGTASDQLTDSLTALGHDVSYAGTLIDQMAKTSQKSNTTIQGLGEGILQVGGTAKSLRGGTEELCTALGLLADNGIKMAEGGTKLRNIILALNPTTDKAIQAWEKLGITAYDADGSLKPLQQTFAELEVALQGMTEQEKTDILTKMFNKTDLKAINALIGTTDERWTQLNTDIINSTCCAQEMADTLNNNLQGKLTIMGSSLEALGISIFEKFDLPLQNAVEHGTDVITALNDEMNGNSKLSASMENLGESVGELAESAINLGELALPVLIDGMSWFLNNSDKIIKGLTAIGTGMLTYKSAMGILNVISAFQKLKAAEESLAITQGILNGVMNLNPAVAIASAVAGLTAAVALHAKEVKAESLYVSEETEALRTQTAAVNDLKSEVDELVTSKEEIINISESQALADEKLVDKLVELDKMESLSAGQMQQKLAIMNDLNEKYPEMGLAIDETTKKLNLSKEAMKKFIDNAKQTAIVTALQEKYTEAAEKQAEAEINRTDAEGKLRDVEQELIIAQQERNKCEKEFQAGVIDGDTYKEACDKVGDLANQQKELQTQIATSDETIKECENSFKDIDSTVEKYSETISETTNSVNELETVSDELQEAISETWEDAEKSLNKYAESLDEVEKKDKVTAEQLIKNQTDRIKEMESYNKNVQELAKKAPDYIVKYLTDGGMDALETIKAVNSMSEKELEEFINNYDELGGLVAESTVSTIEGVYGVVESSYGTFVTKGEETIEKYADGMKKGEGTAEEASEEVAGKVETNLEVKSAESAGIKVAEQYANGISSAQAKVQKAIEDTSATGTEKFKKVAEEMEKTGVLFSSNYKSGIESKKTEVGTASNDVKQQAYNQFVDISTKANGFGVYFGQGLATGIRAKKADVALAARELADAAENSTKTALDIHSPSKKAKALGKYYAQGLAEGIKSNKKYAESSSGEISKAILSKAEQHLSNYKVYHNISLKDEMSYWDNIRKQCKKGTQARIDADAKYLEAKKAYTEQCKNLSAEEAKATLDNAEKKLDKYEIYHDVSLKYEVDYWNKVRKQCKSGTDARLEADKKYYEAKEAYEEKMQEASEEWANNQKEVYTDLKESVSELWKEYEKEVANTAKSISNTAGGIADLFDWQANISEYETKDTLIEKMKSQVEGLSEWKEQLATLRTKGVEESLIEELESMGSEEGLGYIKLINQMSAIELKEYNDLWKQKQVIAKNEATVELEDLKAETNAKIKELTKEANTKIKEYFAQYQEAVKEAGGTLNTTMESFTTKVSENGELMIKKTTKKIKSAASSNTAKANVKSAITTIASQVSASSSSFESAGKKLGLAVVSGMQRGIASASLNGADINFSTVTNAAKGAIDYGLMGTAVVNAIKNANLAINVNDEAFATLVSSTVKKELS